MQSKKSFIYIIMCAIVCILSFDVHSDVITLKNGSSIKGYIVKKTDNSCLLQTHLGTVDLVLGDIRDIEYETSEANLTFLARKYMIDNKLNEAIDYYNQALDKNPNYKQAQDGLKEVKKRIKKHEKHLREIEEKNQAKKENIKEKILKAHGVELKINITGIEVINVLPDSKAAASGLQEQDIICAINERSLLKLQDFEILELLEAEFDSVENICFYRKYILELVEIKYHLKKRKVLGIILVEKNNYIEIDEVIKNSSADIAGLMEKDKIKKINGRNIEGKSLKEVAAMTKKSNKVDLLILRCLR
ncbi:MAG: PDZ domain-containing protein [Candidatus Kappaea frigidicola]|nr:PDZ domain-containing protein [Candidatus Kappaea frigidicola]